MTLRCTHVKDAVCEAQPNRAFTSAKPSLGDRCQAPFV
jgi:hypothetical protein